MDNRQATCQTSKTSVSWTQPLDFMALTANHRLGPGRRVSHSFCQNGRVKLTSQRPLQKWHPTYLRGLEPREHNLASRYHTQPSAPRESLCCGCRRENA